MVNCIFLHDGRRNNFWIRADVEEWIGILDLNNDNDNNDSKCRVEDLELGEMKDQTYFDWIAFLSVAKVLDRVVGNLKPTTLRCEKLNCD